MNPSEFKHFSGPEMDHELARAGSLAPFGFWGSTKGPWKSLDPLLSGWNSLAVQAIIPLESVSPTEKIERFAAEQIQDWLDAADQFLKWERAHVLLGEPSPSLATQHRRVLTVLLKFLRAMYQEAKATDLNDTIMTGLALRLRKLESSWNMFYNPTPESEAAIIRQRCFPE
jgi:hypothetical protein